MQSRVTNEDRPTWCHLLFYSIFNAQHVSDVSSSILRSLRLICGFISCVILLWFDVCWYYGVVCFSLHKDTTPPQPNHTVTPTHIEPEQYNTWNESAISRKLLKMDALTFETCWAINNEIIKRMTSSWSIVIQHWSTCNEFNWFPN